MNKSETIVKIATALVKAQSQMGNAIKDAKNPFFKSKYADLNAVREACIPALNANGVSVLQPTTVLDGKLYVETLLLHESGEYISGVYEVVVGKANDPQSLGAAISYSRRYGLQSMVNIGADDDDAESAMGRNTGAKPANKAPEVKTEAKTETKDATPPARKGFGVKADAKAVVEAQAKIDTTTEDGWA